MVMNICLYIYICVFFIIKGLLSSSLLLFPQHFSRYVLRPSSRVCQTREPPWNFELCLLLNPWGSTVLILLAITGYNYQTSSQKFRQLIYMCVYVCEYVCVCVCACLCVWVCSNLLNSALNWPCVASCLGRGVGKYIPDEYIGKIAM